MKNRRHHAILDIISNTHTVTQADLTQKLTDGGFKVTQATVSRDIKELGLIKLQTPSGYKYALPSAVAGHPDSRSGIFMQSVISVSYAQHTIVVKTLAGMAQAVAVGVDDILVHEILGCIAGDDTVLIITASEQDAAALCEKLRIMCVAG